jgi:hypothetical protein
MQKISFQGPEEFSDKGECKKNYGWREKCLAINSGIYQSLLKEFSDGKLMQKGFFHSVLAFILTYTHDFPERCAQVSLFSC